MIKGRVPAFWKNASTVLGGTALAQLIPIAVLPIFTRILPQDQLGSYFVWFGAVSVLTVIATGRFDMAVYTARTEEQIRNLLAVTFLVSIVVAISTLLLAVSWQYGLGGSLLEGGASNYVWAWVFCAVAMSNYQMAMAVCVYRSHFKKMALAKIALAGSIAIFQLYLSALGFGLAGLVYANLTMACVVTFFIMVRSGYSPFVLLNGFTKEKFSKTVRENYRFPLFSMPADFINSFAAQMPLFVIVAKYGSAAVAGYALVLRVLAGPIGLLANSVLAAFKDEAGRAYRDAGNCIVEYRYTFRSLAVLAVVPFSILFMFGKPLVVWAFGDTWSDAGTYAEILAPMFFMKFIASPLSYTLYIANKQVHDLMWQVGLLIMTWMAFYLIGSLQAAIAAYSAGYTFLYVIYLALSYWAAHGDKA